MRIQREREVVRGSHHKLTQERLGADLTSYPIPEGFERKEAAMGKGKREAVAWTQSYGYQTTKLRQIRAALVNGGPNIQVDILSLLWRQPCGAHAPQQGHSHTTIPFCNPP